VTTTGDDKAIIAKVDREISNRIQEAETMCISEEADARQGAYFFSDGVLAGIVLAPLDARKDKGNLYPEYRDRASRS